MINLAIGGSAGRMGQRLVALATHDPRFTVVGQYDRSHMPEDETFDCLVDFSLPAGTRAFAERCQQRQAALVTGTTGLSAEDLAILRTASRDVPVLRADNFSLGVNMLLTLLPEVARRLGEAFDIEIVETHHRRKVDAPSGTAVALLDSILEATGATRDDVIGGRSGHVGARPTGQIGVHAVRGGDIVGRHDVLFAGPGECISIQHEALSRDTFAAGALHACAWLTGKPAGWYSMADVVR